MSSQANTDLFQIFLKKSDENKYIGSLKALARFCHCGEEAIKEKIREMDRKGIIKFYDFNTDYFIAEILHPSSARP